MYRLISTFPKTEQYNLTDQMRRAATSVMANIAEGSAMPTIAHRNSFYALARGSAIETDSLSELAFELRYITKEEYDDFCEHVARVRYLITRLMG